MFAENLRHKNFLINMTSTEIKSDSTENKIDTSVQCDVTIEQNVSSLLNNVVTTVENLNKVDNKEENNNVPETQEVPMKEAPPYRCDSSSDDDVSSSSSGSQLSIDSSSSSDLSDSFYQQMPKKEFKPEAVKTNGELGLDDLPPIEELTISVEKEELEKVGHIYSMVDKLVIVQSIEDLKALDLGSVIFLSSEKTLGRVFDVFGPVAKPFYCVRFNSAEDVKSKNITVDEDVYYAPRKSDITTFVFLDALRQQKGSDASWKDNNEPPEECIDYSDDEQERKAKQLKRKDKSRSDSGIDMDNHIQFVKVVSAKPPNPFRVQNNRYNRTSKPPQSGAPFQMTQHFSSSNFGPIGRPSTQPILQHQIPPGFLKPAAFQPQLFMTRPALMAPPPPPSPRPPAPQMGSYGFGAPPMINSPLFVPQVHGTFPVPHVPTFGTSPYAPHSAVDNQQQNTTTRRSLFGYPNDNLTRSDQQQPILASPSHSMVLNHFSPQSTNKPLQQHNVAPTQFDGVNTGQSPPQSQPYSMNVPTTYQPFTMAAPTVEQPFSMNYPATNQAFSLVSPTANQPYGMPTSQAYSIVTPTANQQYSIAPPGTTQQYSLITPGSSQLYSIVSPTTNQPNKDPRLAGQLYSLVSPTSTVPVSRLSPAPVTNQPLGMATSITGYQPCLIPPPRLPARPPPPPARSTLLIRTPPPQGIPATSIASPPFGVFGFQNRYR